MKKILIILPLSLLIIFSCSLKEVTDKDLEMGTSNVKILDELSLIDDEEDKAVKKVIGIEDEKEYPSSKENKALKGKHNPIEKEVRKRSYILGKKIRLGYKGGTYEGIVVDIRAKEGLRVRLTGGDLQLFPGDHTQIFQIFE